MIGWTGDGGGRGTEVARNNDGGGAWEDGGEVDGPRGKGMQDIAAPRDTRGRNLHDGAGDVLQSSSPPTTKSLVAPMYEWPILLGLSLGKSIYSDYRFFSCIPRPLALPSDGLGPEFYPRSYQSARLDRRNKDFIF